MATAHSTPVSRWPRWGALLLGAACVLIGATLITRPFQSLAVLIVLVAVGAIFTGLSELTDRTANATVAALVIGIAWLIFGVAILLWPGLSFETLTLLVSLALIVSGLARALAARRAEADQRLAALLLGGATIVLGLVALGWPDLTLLVVAALFGIRLVIFGLTRMVSALWPRGRRAKGGERRAPGRLRRFATTIGAAIALVAALALAGLSLRLHQGAPTIDAFYAAPDALPDQPGVLLRTAPMTRAIPANAQAWRILYTTTRADDVPALASALVVTAKELPAGPRPVIAWAHGTTGVDATCAPSLLKDPFTAGAMPALDQVIANGWVLVATDYTGLGTTAPHAYLVGEQAGRAVLDAIRAARQLPVLTLAEQTVVWGHSQGGGAALWTGVLASSYAPETNVIGVAALAPASDLPSLVGNLDVVPGGAIFASYII